MTRISRRPLKKDLTDRMFHLFWQSFTHLKSEKDSFEFLDDLLSESEKVMLAKRLAIVILLEKGWNYESIAHALKVSTSTVNSLQSKMNYRGNGFRKMVNHITSQEQVSEFFEKLAIDISGVLAVGTKYGLMHNMNKETKMVNRIHRQKRVLL